MATPPQTTSNLINSAAFNRITTNHKRQFYKDLAYIDNQHDFCSERSDICKRRKVEFETISGKRSTATEISKISHSKCEEEDEIFKAMLASSLYTGSISAHIKNLIYEQTMNSLYLPNGPNDRKAWNASVSSDDQPVHVHIVFSKLSIDGNAVFTKDTRSLIISIFENSINNFGTVKTNRDIFSSDGSTQLSQSKVYSIDASCINFLELLNAHDINDKKVTKFIHLNDGASKFDSATKLMPDEKLSMKTIELPPNGIVQLITANISPLIIKRTNSTPKEIVWTNLFNRFSYCFITTDTSKSVSSPPIYPFMWLVESSILLTYQTYMLVDPECFMYSVSVQANNGTFLQSETYGYTLILCRNNGILIRTEGRETTENKVGIGSISVATLTKIYSFDKKKDTSVKDEPIREAYEHFEKMIIHLNLVGNSSTTNESIKKISLDFKRCGDQLAVMSLKQLNDLSNNKVAFVSLDRLAYTYSKVLGVCTSIRVGVAGAYFEEPDGDEKQPDSIDYINESGHNYNLWIHRTEIAKELTPQEVFNRTIDISKNVLGETAKYIIERFSDNRQTQLNELLNKFKLFTDNSVLYIESLYRTELFFGTVHKLIILFTLLINLNIYYINLILSKIDELSSYFKDFFEQKHIIEEQVVFKSKLELLEELNKKLKRAYLELPNNLVEKMISNLNKYFKEIESMRKSKATTPKDLRIYTYRYFEIYLGLMNESLKGDDMEANYGILLHKIINDHDKTLPSLKDHTIYADRMISRHRPTVTRNVPDMCKAVLNSVKIIATSIYGVVFKNIDKLLSDDDAATQNRNDEIRLQQIEDLKVRFNGIVSTDEIQYKTNLNDLITIIINDITSKLDSNHTNIAVKGTTKREAKGQVKDTTVVTSSTLCSAKYNNYYKQPETPTTKTVQINVDESKLVIPPQDNLIDISNIITLFTETSKIDSIITDMNTFVFTYGTKQTTIPESIRPLSTTFGKTIIDLKALNADFSININEFEKTDCSSNGKGGLCNLTILQLIDAFNDEEYESKVLEFIIAKVGLTTEIKHNLISFAIINKLLKLSGNKDVSYQPIRPITIVEQGGGGGVGEIPIEKFTFNSKYILNCEYVLSLSLAKKYFKEFHWDYRLKLALQFLDSTMRFYDRTHFTHTIHLINMTRKYCNYLLDTYDLVSFEPLNTILDKSINPAIAQILQLYLKEIYLPSFHTVRKIAVSLFPNDVINTLNNVKKPLNMNSSSSSRRRFLTGYSSFKRPISMRGIQKSNRYSSNASSKSKKSNSFGRIKGNYNVSLRRIASAPNLKYYNSGLIPSFEFSSLNIVASANSIHDSIEARIDIINQPDEYNLEKLYINFTTDVYTCGEIATVYFDEEFCKIPGYKEMFQTSYTTQLKTQTLIPSPPNRYYSLIPFQLEPDEHQSFIMKKSIDFENVYNLINLFKLFKRNPLDIDGYSADFGSNNPLEMFDLENMYITKQLGQLVGNTITVEETLETIAAFVYNVQSMVIQYYQQPKQIPSKGSKLSKDTRRIISSVSGGSSLSPSKKSRYRRSENRLRTSNRFVFITPKLKLFVMTVEIYNESTDDITNTKKIIEPNETHLSQIEFENTLEVKECLLRLTDVFNGMIHNDTIPPYTLETTEIYDFK